MQYYGAEMSEIDVFINFKNIVRKFSLNSEYYRNYYYAVL